MSVGSERFGWGDSMPAAQGTAATGAPDFARHDRGPDDDHWAGAAGEPCVRCEQAIVEGQFVRRRADGGWVHEGCPATPPA
jgi:hypothetical protein